MTLDQLSLIYDRAIRTGEMKARHSPPNANPRLRRTACSGPDVARNSSYVNCGPYACSGCAEAFAWRRPHVRWTIAVLCGPMSQNPPYVRGVTMGSVYKSFGPDTGAPLTFGRVSDEGPREREIHALGLIEYASLEKASLSFGISSSSVMAVCSVPPDTPPRRRTAVRDAPRDAPGPSAALRVLAARKALMSEGRESKPQEGIMIACVLCAR